MVEHEWCGNDTVLNFCSRYLVEEAELNNATFDAANSVKIHDQTLLWFYGIVFVVGFICNIIVIIGMLTDYSSMVTCSHIYALHMAIADLILLCLLPFQIVEIKNNETWFFGLIFCKIYRTIKVMNFLVSISFLTLMSIDRYKAISGSSYKPVRQRRRPPKSAHAIAAAVWIFAFSLSIPGTAH